MTSDDTSDEDVEAGVSQKSAHTVIGCPVPQTRIAISGKVLSCTVVVRTAAMGTSIQVSITQSTNASAPGDFRAAMSFMNPAATA